MGYREPGGVLLDVNGVGMKLPGCSIASATLVDIAANWILRNWHNTQISLETR